VTLQRPVRRLSLSSESDSSHEKGKRSPRVSTFSKGGLNADKKSTSPRPSGQLKRKQLPTAQPPPPKRKRPSESNAGDDPTRKYCLGKLLEVFNQIFLKYPFVRVQGEDEKVEKAPEELTEEDQEQLREEAKNFATELELCVYDIYSEPDKQGKPSVGGKYKCVHQFNGHIISFPYSFLTHILLQGTFSDAPIQFKQT